MATDTPALDFERPILDLERRIRDLKRAEESGSRGSGSRGSGSRGSGAVADEIRKLERRVDRLLDETFATLSPWQVVQLSRHPRRPYTLDYVDHLLTEFTELHGDRAFADDPAIVGGIGYFDHRPLMVIGHQKGRNTKENVRRNFGMPRPEGYRKAKRLMELAARFSIPVVTLIDTVGAYPGLGAEQRGQAEAIAKNLEVMMGLPVPIIAVVIGEGGSGGALALGVADRILMMQYSTYSVISPEGCASILWKDGAMAPEAARVLKISAKDVEALGVADSVVSEPRGGAHRDSEAAAANIGKLLRRHLSELSAMDTKELLQRRYDKFRKIGVFQHA